MPYALAYEMHTVNIYRYFAQICFAHEIVQKKSEAEHFGKIAKMFCALFTKKVQDFLSFYTTWDTYI